MEKPKIIKGNSSTDSRGTINFNNSFNAVVIKRMYIIQNISTDFLRGWQGHKIEKRWFTVIQGSFNIFLIAVDNWDLPNRNLKSIKYSLDSDCMSVLYVPSGYISCIKSNEKDSKLLAMSNYTMGEIKDEYRFNLSYFKIEY